MPHALIYYTSGPYEKEQGNWETKNSEDTLFGLKSPIPFSVERRQVETPSEGGWNTIQLVEIRPLEEAISNVRSNHLQGLFKRPSAYIEIAIEEVLLQKRCPL